MPAGSYRILDERGEPAAVEAFRSAPGPMGWRYFSTVTSLSEPATGNVDLSVDAAWRPVRARVQNGAHHTLLIVRGSSVMGVLDDEELNLPYDPAMGIEYPSPCFLAASANRLGESVALDVLAIDPLTLSTRAETHRYERVGDEERATPAGTFAATHWRFIAPRPRFSRSFWVAGEVCVAAEGLYELIAYEAQTNGPVPLR